MWNIRNRVQLVWVPGHIGNKGNEIEDGLAKEGVSCPFTGPGLALASDLMHLNWLTDIGWQLSIFSIGSLFLH